MLWHLNKVIFIFILIRLDFNVLADDILGAVIVQRSNVVTLKICDSALLLILKVETA